MWALDDSQSRSGEAVKVLALHLAKPALTETEITWKKGALPMLHASCEPHTSRRKAGRPAQGKDNSWRASTSLHDNQGVRELIPSCCAVQACGRITGCRRAQASHS